MNLASYHGHKKSSTEWLSWLLLFAPWGALGCPRKSQYLMYPVLDKHYYDHQNIDEEFYSWIKLIWNMSNLPLLHCQTWLQYGKLKVSIHPRMTDCDNDAMQEFIIKWIQWNFSPTADVNTSRWNATWTGWHWTFVKMFDARFWQFLIATV